MEHENELKLINMNDVEEDKALNKEVVQYDLHEINARLSKLGVS